jgi:hypothetical protein
MQKAQAANIPLLKGKKYNEKMTFFFANSYAKKARNQLR